MSTQSLRARSLTGGGSCRKRVTPVWSARLSIWIKIVFLVEKSKLFAAAYLWTALRACAPGYESADNGSMTAWEMRNVIAVDATRV